MAKIKAETSFASTYMIFHKEIYATACIVGAITFLVLNRMHVEHNISYVITTSIVITIRLIAVKLKLKLPSFYT